MSEPVKVVVVLEGGCVQGIYTLGVPVECVIIDYDVDGADPTEVDVISLADGGTAEAYLSPQLVEPLDPAIMASIDHLWSEMD